MTYRETAELGLRSKYLRSFAKFRLFAFHCLSQHLHPSSTDLSVYVDFSASLSPTSSPFSIVTRSPPSGFSSNSHSHFVGNYLLSLTSHSSIWHYEYDYYSNYYYHWHYDYYYRWNYSTGIASHLASFTLLLSLRFVYVCVPVSLPRPRFPSYCTASNSAAFLLRQYSLAFMPMVADLH